MSEEKKHLSNLTGNKKLVARPVASKLKAAATVLPKNEVQEKAEKLSKKLVPKKVEDVEDDFDEVDEEVDEELDEELEEETKPATKKSSKKKSKKETSKETKKSSTKEIKAAKDDKEEPEYNGPRVVRVFGRDIYTENDPSLSFEQIRQKLEKEYSFPNFKADKVYYDFDSSTGVLEVLLKFNSKG